MAARPYQRYLAEFLGTFALLLLGGGTAVMSLQLNSILGANGGFPDRVFLVSAAMGLTVLGGSYAFGEISGAHFNPAVTVSMAIAGRMERGDILPYIVAQLLGAIFATEVILGIVEGSPTYLSAAQASALASQCYAGNGSPCGISLAGAFLLEAVLTFTFVLVIQLVTRETNPTRSFAPIAIGFTLLVANMVSIPLDGGSINPARSLGPALVSIVWSSDRWAITEVWLFVVATILGGAIAALVYRVFKPTES